VAKLTILTHSIAIQLHLMAESCTICSSLAKRPVRKLLDTSSYVGCHPDPKLGNHKRENQENNEKNSFSWEKINYNFIHDVFTWHSATFLLDKETKKQTNEKNEKGNKVTTDGGGDGGICCKYSFFRNGMGGSYDQSCSSYSQGPIKAQYHPLLGGGRCAECAS